MAAQAVGFKNLDEVITQIDRYHQLSGGSIAEKPQAPVLLSSLCDSDRYTTLITDSMFGKEISNGFAETFVLLGEVLNIYRTADALLNPTVRRCQEAVQAILPADPNRQSQVEGIVKNAKTELEDQKKKLVAMVSSVAQKVIQGAAGLPDKERVVIMGLLNISMVPALMKIEQAYEQHLATLGGIR